MTSMSRIVTGPDSVTYDDADSVRVQLVGGSLDVVERAEPGVLVEILELSGQPLEVATEAERVSIGYPSIGWDGWAKRLVATDRSDRAVIRLHIGKGATLSVATVSAAVTATATTGDVDVSTATAPVHVERGTGGVKIRTASGPVVVASHHGPASVVTASGSVELDGELPRPTVTTVSGDITVRHGGSAAVVTTTTVAGRTHIRLPADSPLELEVRGVSASVTVDGVQQGGGFGVTKVAEDGTGERVLVTATTVSGEVVVDRSDPFHLTTSPSDVEDA